MTRKNLQCYNGIPLVDYCKTNNIKIEKIRNRISKLKKRYPNKTIDEIITMAIEYQNEKNKYYYKGILLVDYCDLYDLKYDTIRYRITSLSKKFPNKTMEDIIELAINSAKEEYFYNDIPLKEYCELNNLKYSKINTRIKTFKKRYPDKDIDEIIDMAINFQLWYYYNGIPLKKYCDSNNLNYVTVKARIQKFKEKYPDKDIDEIIDMAIKYQNNHHNYIYDNMPLSKYCKLNNLNYRTITDRIKKFKEKYSDKDIDEIIDMAIHYQFIYYYKGISLRKYCILNDLNYPTISSRVQRLKEKFPEKNIEEIIDMAIKYQNNHHNYIYDNMSLSKYCILNNLSYRTITDRIKKFKEKYPEKDIDEIIDMAVKHNNNYNHYFYDNISLFKYCKLNNFAYSTITNRIRKFKELHPEKSIDEIIDLATNNIKEKIKYYYNDQPLTEWCTENDVDYKALYARIYRRNKKGLEIELDKLLEEYNDKTERLKIMDILKKEIYFSEDEVKEACTFLEISYDNVNEYIKNNFSIKNAINIVYFFGEENDNNLKIVSEEKFNSIKNFCSTIDKNIYDKEWLEDNILVLYKLYKCNIFDSQIIFIIFFKKYMYSLIYKTFDRFKITSEKEKVEDVYGELNLKLIELLNRCYTLNKLQFIKYITLSLKFYCTDYCYNNFLFKEDSLDYQDLDKPNKYTFIDADSKIEDELENSIDECFSEQLKNAINNLDKNSLIFIKLKYILQYDNYLIADYLDLSVDEVDKIEENILNYLRNNPYVISLTHKK